METSAGMELPITEILDAILYFEAAAIYKESYSIFGDRASSLYEISGQHGHKFCLLYGALDSADRHLMLRFLEFFCRGEPPVNPDNSTKRLVEYLIALQYSTDVDLLEMYARNGIGSHPLLQKLAH